MGRELSKENAERIFAEYSHFVYRVVLFLIKSPELADDITQETFIQIFRKYHLFDPAKPIKPWIYKIALNTTRNMLRKQPWMKFVAEMPEARASERGLEPVEEAVLKSEADQELWRAIMSLRLKNREVIILHFYSGLKLHEVSDALGIPVGTCKSRLNAALNALRKRLPKLESDLFQGGELYESSWQ